MNFAVPAILDRLSRFPLAIPMVILIATLTLLINEVTYRSTTKTLATGIVLTDARISASRLLQLLTDAETAQRGYLLTEESDYLQLFETARSEIPATRDRLKAFLEQTGQGGHRMAESLQRDIDEKLAELSTTITLASSGSRQAALGVVTSGLGKARMDDIRQTLKVSLDEGTRQQAEVRVSLFDSLWINRLVVGILTLLSAIGLVFYIRHLRMLDMEIGARQRELEAQVSDRTAELRELAAHMQTVREDEKAHLARELHDELGGLLTAVKFDLARIRPRCLGDAVVQERLAQAEAHLNQGIELKRRVIEGLRPSALLNLGLKVALGILCSEFSAGQGIPVYAEIDDVQATPDTQLALYRFVQEALTNISKYADASEVHVDLTQTDEAIQVHVTDNGIGFDPTVLQVGKHGVSGMRFRISRLGGTMSVKSEPGNGATLFAEVPRRSAPE